MSKTSRAESSCGRKSDNTLLQLPNDVIGIAKNRLSSLSIKFRAPSDSAPRSPDLQRNKSSTLSYFRKPKSKHKTDSSDVSDNQADAKETHRNEARPKIQRQTSIDIPKSRPISMVSSKRQNSTDNVECARSFPGTHKYGIFNNHHEVYSQSQTDDGRKPAIESICLFPKLVFPVHSSALASSSITLNTDSLERPRKKLSFREPEIVELKKTPSGNPSRKPMLAALSDVSEDKSDGAASVQSYPLSGEENDLESQAMRIVRTVGQAFEVCHKLSPEAPAEAASSSTACDISQEGALSISDKVSEISDKPKKDSTLPIKNFSKENHEDSRIQHHLAEPPASNKAQQPLQNQNQKPQRPAHLDVDVTLIPTPRINQQTPQSREATPGYIDRSIMTTPQATEHREKLLEESLEQQRQQTRAATAQLAMLNDQLVVEKAARVEAQARTHQLLLHNKELIDHISMLVAHLQERERGGLGSLPYSISAHQLTSVPQPLKEISPEVRTIHPPAPLVLDNRPLLEPTSALLPPLSPSIILPRSPHSPHSLRDSAFEPNNNSPLTGSSIDSPSMFQPQFNSQYTYPLHEPPVSPVHRRYNNIPSLNSAFIDRQNANEIADFLMDLVNQQSNGQIPGTPQLQRQTNNVNRHQMYVGQGASGMLGAISPNENLYSTASLKVPNDMGSQSFSNMPIIQQTDPNNVVQEAECNFIRPLSQIGTITTVDEDGRVRIVVPTKKSPQPIITRTTSERVPNKSVLMAQVRDQWGRHTTK